MKDDSMTPSDDKPIYEPYVKGGHIVGYTFKNPPSQIQMKENVPTPETVKTPPPLTPKDSLSVEVEERLEAIRRDFILRDSHIVLDDVASRHVNSLFAIIRELQEQIELKNKAFEILKLVNVTDLTLLREYGVAQEKLLDLRKERDILKTIGDSAMVRVKQQVEELATAQEQNKKLREALEKLSKLGNGELCGNSVGNQIALDALADGKEGGR